MSRKRRGRGEGSIYQDGKGHWCASISAGYNVEGKRRRRKVTGKTKQAVQTRLTDLLRAGPPPAESNKLTVGSFVTRWLENVARPRVGAATYERYESCVRLHLIPHLDRIRLAKLDADRVEQFYMDLKSSGVSQHTAKYTATVLTAALRHAVRRKLIASNPAGDVPKPRVEEKEMRCLDAAQVKLFLIAARSHRTYPLFALAIGSGMRQGEILGLHWADLDFDRGTVTVRRSLSNTRDGFVLKEPKSRKSRRTIQLPAFVLDALAEHRKNQLAAGLLDAPVFCAKNGNFLQKCNLITQYFKPILRKAQVPDVRFHDLRHTHASVLLANGCSIKAVSQRLGHGNVELTLRVYCHVMPGDDKALAQGAHRLFG